VLLNPPRSQKLTRLTVDQLRALKTLNLGAATRGEMSSADSDIAALIDQLAAQGKGIILASSELPELFRCCDRILVMHEGRQAGILDTATTSQAEIMSLATGVQH